MNRRYRPLLGTAFLVTASITLLTFLTARVSAATPATRPATSQPAGPTDEDFENRAASLRRILGPDFTVLIEKPFIVAGDGDPAAVRAATEQTVRWAVKMLKQDYFSRDPDEVLMIYLFKDAQSYNTNNQALFGTEPPTPYGYFSTAHKALVMNIDTGGGTLVHEIVHPFVRANFPRCPRGLTRASARSTSRARRRTATSAA